MFRQKIRIRFQDADAEGILFFGRVYELAHVACEDFVQSLGLTWDEYFDNPDWGVPIRHSECDYFAPFPVGQEFEIGVKVEKVGESSMTLIYTFDRQGKTHAVVKLVHAFVSRKTRTKTSIPLDLRKKLEAYQAKHVTA